MNLPSGLSLYAIDVDRKKLSLLDEYLVPGKTLDIGCGNGLYGLHAATFGSEVLQIDVEDRREARARGLPLRIMDAQRLDLADSSYENVLAFDIMEHLDDDRLFLREVRRVCGKRLLLSVPNADDEQPRKLALTHIHHTDKTHRRAYLKEEIAELMELTGFRVVAITPNTNMALPYFAHALARDMFAAKVAAGVISLQCRVLQALGLFENRCIGDWYCVGEVR